MPPKIRHISYTLLLLAVLSGCGQKGPLFLPGDESAESPPAKADSSSPTPEAETQQP